MTRRTEILALLLVAPAACSKPLNVLDCHKLLDHYTELLARQNKPKVSSAEVARLQNEARLHAAHSGELSKCTTKVSRSQYNCALAARTVDDVERCLL